MSDEHFEQEEAFHEKDKKQWRNERKILSRTDRSKYKKTDLDKVKKETPNLEGLEKGRVLAIMADGILVDGKDTLYTCSLRGALKKDSQRIKNLIAVGDIVYFTAETKETGAIDSIEERTSILARAEQINRKRQQLIAVNIDQVLITGSMGTPTLKPTLIDRYIIAALRGNMDPVLVINKIDLSDDPAYLSEIVSIYENLGIPVFLVSAKTNKGIDALKKQMAGKSSVLSGQSGAGKTSLINRITGSSYLTKNVIAKTGKGAHTTTSTRLLPIEGDGFCVDTPGIKSFGMWDLKVEGVQEFFFEIAEIAKDCKFPDCSHVHEPDCAVKKALESGEISHLRFDSYCALIATLKDDKKR